MMFTTKKSSDKLWCDLLHDPEIGSHIVLQRDLAQPVKILRHFYAWSAKQPPFYKAAIKRKQKTETKKKKFVLEVFC